MDTERWNILKIQTTKMLKCFYCYCKVAIYYISMEKTAFAFLFFQSYAELYVINARVNRMQQVTSGPIHNNKT